MSEVTKLEARKALDNGTYSEQFGQGKKTKAKKVTKKVSKKKK